MATAPDTSSATDPNVYFDDRHPDPDYFGADNIVRAEHAFIKDARKRDPKALAGLALSGGGIRSASFCLGVLQALAYRDWLPKIDYLSTVSGGGYIGSCLSYLLHRKWSVSGPSGQPAPGVIEFSVKQENFPLGSSPMVGYPVKGQDIDKRQAMKDMVEDPYHRYRGKLLRFLRQHAKYLTPGRWITILSAIGVAVRNSLLSLAFFVALVALFYAFLLEAGHLPPGAASNGSWTDNRLLAAAALFGAVFLALAPLYGLFTWLSGRMFGDLTAYRWRRCLEVAFTVLIGGAFVLVVLGAVPYAYHKLPKYTVWSVMDQDLTWRQIAGAASAAIGVFSSIVTFLQTSRGKRRVPTGLLVAVGAVTLIFALLILGYNVAEHMRTDGYAWWLAVVATLALGWLVNLNFLSLHRYYRDRLTETFLPNVGDVLSEMGDSRSACAVEGSMTNLAAIWGATHGTPNGRGETGGPYHIINANVVLVSSDTAKYRGRGGDNFILSPLFCGSNATGWASTDSVLYRDLTLATAMSISGAAVNPNAGCDGEGVTRQPFLAMLMGILNIRLGYWLENPKWLLYRGGRHGGVGTQPAVRVGKWGSRALMRAVTICRTAAPNFFYPGLGEVLFRTTLNEESCLIQLSDGGHFENLGIYELVRRKLKLIIACDAGADPDYQFTDLANAIEKVRVDFGALILFDEPGLEDLMPVPKSGHSDDEDAMTYAARSYIVGRIIYADNSVGTLIYLTTNFTRGLSADLYGYRRTHPEFPDEPTSDQFFDERQFEAYRELGYQIAFALVNDADVAENRGVREAIGDWALERLG